MTLRGSVSGLVAISLGVLVAGCNDSKIVSGASCPTNPNSSPISSAASQAPQGPAPIRNHPAPVHFTPSGSQSASAADATPATAAQLLAAMDVTGATSPVLTGDPKQAAAFNGLGAIAPTKGSNFAWLSTGISGTGTPKALDPLAASGGSEFVYTQPGANVADPLGLSGGGACPGITDSYDCVQLQFSVAVPTGAHSIAFDFNFMSAEFPEFVNLGFNDTFTVSMSSPSHSYDNIVFDHQNHPINIDNAFFTQPCTDLHGTGFGMGEQDPLSSNLTACDAGGTGPLTTQAPVAEGETVTFKFTIHDSGDGVYDSAVMIDNFRFDNGSVDNPNTDPCSGN